MLSRFGWAAVNTWNRFLPKQWEQWWRGNDKRAARVFILKYCCAKGMFAYRCNLLLFLCHLKPGRFIWVPAGRGEKLVMQQPPAGKRSKTQDLFLIPAVSFWSIWAAAIKELLSLAKRWVAWFPCKDKNAWYPSTSATGHVHDCFMLRLFLPASKLLWLPPNGPLSMMDNRSRQEKEHFNYCTQAWRCSKSAQSPVPSSPSPLHAGWGLLFLSHCYFAD